MPVERFRIKPSGTLWVRVELIITYSCREDAKVERVRITGLKQFGLIVSSEYEIDAMVDTCKPVPCDTDVDCRDAVAYELIVKVYVSDVIGLGIGLGKLGTGTAGWTTNSTEEVVRLHTACMCCEGERQREGRIAEAADILQRIINMMRVAPPPEPATRWIVGFATAATALVLSILNFRHPSLIPMIVVYVMGVGAAISLGVGLFRLILSSRRRVSERRKQPMVNPGGRA